MGTSSLQPFLKSYWLTPVQLTGQLSRSIQILTSSRGSINAEPATITSESFPSRPIPVRRCRPTAVFAREQSKTRRIATTTASPAWAWLTRRWLWRSLTAQNCADLLMRWGLAGMWPVQRHIWLTLADLRDADHKVLLKEPWMLVPATVPFQIVVGDPPTPEEGGKICSSGRGP